MIPRTTPHIEVLYTTDCPHVAAALATLRDVLRAQGLAAAPIEQIHVETEAQATALDFHGSPTVRINGRDVLPVSPGTPPSLACRLYRDGRGGMASSPSADVLATALDAAVQVQPYPGTKQPSNDRQAPAPIPRRAALKAGAAAFATLLSLSHMTPALADELARLANDQPMTGARLAEILRAERVRWKALLDQVGLARMDVPGVDGEWSVKELVAHLSWYEQAVVEGAQSVASTGKFTRRRPAGWSIDEMNAQIAAQARSRPAADVLAAADAVFEQLLAVIEPCPPELLNNPHILGLPDDMVPWMGVANNSYAHYREHETAVRDWLARQEPS